MKETDSPTFSLHLAPIFSVLFARRPKRRALSGQDLSGGTPVPSAGLGAAGYRPSFRRERGKLVVLHRGDALAHVAR